MTMTSNRHAVPKERPERGPVDLVSAELATTNFLAALGVDLGREGLRKTPARVARDPRSRAEFLSLVGTSATV